MYSASTYRFTLFLLLICICFMHSVRCEETAVEDETSSATNGSSDETSKSKAEGLPDDATLRKMKVKELKKLLAKKGPEAECVACTTKDEYVERIRETENWEDHVEEEKDMKLGNDDAPSMEELQKMFGKGKESEEMIKLKESLKKAGIDPKNILNTAGDFDVEAFAKQFGDMGAKGKEKAMGKEEAKTEL